jgi:hypothetical protein
MLSNTIGATIEETVFLGNIPLAVLADGIYCCCVNGRDRILFKNYRNWGGIDFQDTKTTVDGHRHID